MFLRDQNRHKLMQASKAYGVELQHIAKPVYEIIREEVQDLIECQGITAETVRDQMHKHILKHLDQYINLENKPVGIEHPILLIASRMYEVNVIILEEAANENITIIKHKNPKKTIYLIHNGGEIYSSCQSPNIPSQIDLVKKIKEAQVDVTNPELKPIISQSDTLFNAATYAIDKSVKDKNYLGLVQALVGPKLCVPNRHIQSEVLKIKNEIYLTLSALNVVIKSSLYSIEVRFLTEFEKELEETLKLAMINISNEISAKKVQLQQERIRILISVYKLPKHKATEAVERMPIEKLFQFDSPANMTDLQLDTLNLFQKYEECMLSEIKAKREDIGEASYGAVTIIKELKKNVELVFKERTNELLDRMEQINWDGMEIGNVADYIKSQAANFIAEIYQKPLPISCAPQSRLKRPGYPELAVLPSKSANEKPLTYLEYLEIKLKGFIFEIDVKSNTYGSILNQNISKELMNRQEMLESINLEHLRAINVLMIPEEVLEKYISERVAKLCEISEDQVREIKEISSTLPVLPILNDLHKSFEIKLTNLIMKHTKVMQTVIDDEKERLNYINYVKSWLPNNSKRMSPFVQLFNPEEFANSIINLGIYKQSLEKFSDSATGNTLVHRATHHAQSANDINNITLIINFLILQGANIFVKNKIGEYSCDLSKGTFQGSQSWVIARTQLELLTLYSSNIADLVAKTLLEYVTENEQSWMIYFFHSKNNKQSRLKTMFDLFINLDLSRTKDVDKTLLAQLKEIRDDLFQENRRNSLLRTKIVTFFNNAKIKALTESEPEFKNDETYEQEGPINKDNMTNHQDGASSDTDDDLDPTDSTDILGFTRLPVRLN